MKAKKIVLQILLLCFVGVFIFSAWQLYTYYIEGKRAADAFDELSAFVSAGADETLEAHSAEEAAALEAARKRARMQRLIQYAALNRQNPDLFGWVQIEGTPIDYPVMFTPDDPEHYLHRDFNGSYSSSGVPFLDADCKEDGNLYLVYGHHMKNGSMFATLGKYDSNQYWEEHPVILFDTLTETGDYEIMAAFYAKVTGAGSGGFQYYDYTDLSDPEVFDEYVSNVKRLSVIDTGITAEYGDRLVTLSTCSYHTSDGRFVVVGRQKAGDRTDRKTK